MSTEYPAKRGILTSELFAAWDIGKPQVENYLTSRYGDQYESMFGKLFRMGREEAVAASSWSAFEDNWYHDTVVVSAEVTQATPGSSVDFVLDSSKLDADNRFYVRERMVITLPTSLVPVWVSNIDVSTPSAPIITIIPMDVTDAIGTLTAGMNLSITDSAFAEGTGQPKGTVVGTIKRDFDIQIFKETTGLTGSQFINQKWFGLYDEHENVYGYYTTGTLRGEYLTKLALDGAFTTGKQTTNTAVTQERVDMHGVGTGDSEVVRHSKGMIPLTTSLGDTFDYTSGAFDIEDLDDITEYLRSQGISSGVIYMPMGSLLNIDVQNAAKDYVVDAAADGALLNSVISTMSKGDKEVATSLNFKYISRAGFTFVLDVIGGWSNPKVFGNTGYDLNKKGFAMPMTTVKDSVNNTYNDSIHVKYRADKQYNRKFEVWSVAGAGPGLKVSDVDRAEFHIRCESGLGMLKVNQNTYIQNV